jgi:hypothetical protein
MQERFPFPVERNLTFQQTAPSPPAKSRIMTKHITIELIRLEQDENPEFEKHEIGIGSDLNTELSNSKTFYFYFPPVKWGNNVLERKNTRESVHHCQHKVSRKFYSNIQKFCYIFSYSYALHI